MSTVRPASGEQPILSSTRLQAFANAVAPALTTATSKEVLGQLNETERKLLHLSLTLLKKGNLEHLDPSSVAQFAKLGGEDTLTRIQEVLTGLSPRLGVSKISYLAAKSIQTPQLAKELEVTFKYLESKRGVNPFHVEGRELYEVERTAIDTIKELKQLKESSYEHLRLGTKGTGILLSRSPSPTEDPSSEASFIEGVRDEVVERAKEKFPELEEREIESILSEAFFNAAFEDPEKTLSKLDKVEREKGVVPGRAQGEQVLLVLNQVQKEEAHSQKELEALKHKSKEHAEPLISRMVTTYREQAEKYERLATFPDNATIADLLKERATHLRAYASDLARIPLHEDRAFNVSLKRVTKQFEGEGQRLQKETASVKAFMKGVEKNPSMTFPEIRLGIIEGPKAAEKVTKVPAEHTIEIGQIRSDLKSIIEQLDSDNPKAELKTQQLLKNEHVRTLVTKVLTAMEKGETAELTRDEAANWSALFRSNTGTGELKFVEKVKLFFLERSNAKIEAELRFFESLSNVKSSIRQAEEGIFSPELRGLQGADRKQMQERMARLSPEEREDFRRAAEDMQGITPADKAKQLEALRQVKQRSEKELGFYDGIKGYQRRGGPNTASIERAKSRAEGQREFTQNRMARFEIARAIGEPLLVRDEAERVKAGAGTATTIYKEALDNAQEIVKRLLTKIGQAKSKDDIQKAIAKSLKEAESKGTGDSVEILQAILKMTEDYLTLHPESYLDALKGDVSSALHEYVEDMSPRIALIGAQIPDQAATVKAKWLDAADKVSDLEEAQLAEAKIKAQLDIEIDIYKEAIKEVKANKAVVPALFAEMRQAILSGDKESVFVRGEEKAQNLSLADRSKVHSREVYGTRHDELVSTKELLERTAQKGRTTVPFVNQLGAILEAKMAAREALVKKEAEDHKAYQAEVKALKAVTKELQKATSPEKSKGWGLSRLFGLSDSEGHSHTGFARITGKGKERASETAGLSALAHAHSSEESDRLNRQADIRSLILQHAKTFNHDIIGSSKARNDYPEQLQGLIEELQRKFPGHQEDVQEIVEGTLLIPRPDQTKPEERIRIQDLNKKSFERLEREIADLRRQAAGSSRLGSSSSGSTVYQRLSSEREEEDDISLKERGRTGGIGDFGDEAAGIARSSPRKPVEDSPTVDLQLAELRGKLGVLSYGATDDSAKSGLEKFFLDSGGMQRAFILYEGQDTDYHIAYTDQKGLGRWEIKKIDLEEEEGNKWSIDGKVYNTLTEIVQDRFVGFATYTK